MTEISATPEILARIGKAIGSARSDPVRTIWEIGSRDGLDGLALSQAYPGASVVCFEPNPDTFAQVVQSSARSVDGSMRAMSYALCDRDGPATFFKIDPIATKTTWPDGNPGASSMYVASGDYPFEEYVQVPVQVEGRRASSLIEDGFAVPDLVWMDVQGAEMEVLKGFDPHLGLVTAIYVELSLQEMCTGQALAPEVIALLSRSGHKWHSVTRTGTWQFDALFLRSDRSNWRLNVRHHLFSWSLRTRRKFGIARPLPPSNPRQLMAVVARRGIRAGKEVLNRVALGRVPPSLTTRSMRAASSAIRVRYEQAQLSNPLGGGPDRDLPSIEVLIPCVAKDAEIVSVVVASTTVGSHNPIERVAILAPIADHGALTALETHGVELLADEDQVLPRTFGAVEELVPKDRRGWVKQQVLKLAFVARATSKGVLVLDADTILLQPKVWLDGHRQLLAVAHEYHLPYLAHTDRCLGPYGIDEGISWVTHHQLMQPRVVRAMLTVILERHGTAAESQFLDIDGALEAWIRLGDFTEPSAVSEYHMYGAFLRRTEKNNAFIGRWSNVAFAPSTVSLELQDITDRFSTYSSASGHSYLA